MISSRTACSYQCSARAPRCAAASRRRAAHRRRRRRGGEGALTDGEPAEAVPEQAADSPAETRRGREHGEDELAEPGARSPRPGSRACPTSCRATVGVRSTSACASRRGHRPRADRRAVCQATRALSCGARRASRRPRCCSAIEADQHRLVARKFRRASQRMTPKSTKKQT